MYRDCSVCVICRWGEHQGVAEELKGVLQGGPLLPVNTGYWSWLHHRSPTSLSVVSLLQWMNYLSVTLVFMFVIRTNNLCMYLGIIFSLNFQLNLLYHYIQFLLHFVLRRWIMKSPANQFRFFSFFCLADTCHLVAKALHKRRVRKRIWWSQLERLNWGR